MIVYGVGSLIYAAQTGYIPSKTGLVDRLTDTTRFWNSVGAYIIGTSAMIVGLWMIAKRR